MKHIYKNTRSVLLAMSLALNSFGASAEDIDIFTGTSAGAAERPNVLIVLDNTSNWARQSQQWPGGLTQGQAEVRSIKTVLDAIGSDINVGVMEFVTEGNAGNIGGFIRFPVIQMDATNKAALKSQMDTIFGDVNGNTEKRNSGTEYGNLAYDVYNYYAGSDVGSNSSSLNPPSTHVDARGYDTNYSNFNGPLSSANSCAKNYVIFIGNPSSSGPSSDSAANNTELTGLGCSSSNIALPNFTLTTTAVTSNLGNSNACYADAGTCTTNVVTENASCGDGTYSSCSCGTAVAAQASCAAGTQRYSVLATDNQGSSNLGYAASCTANASQCDMSAYAAECTGTGVSCACSATLYQTPNTCSPASKKKFMVVRTKSYTTTDNLGYSAACYTDAATPVYASADEAASCATYAGYATGSGCVYGTPTTTATACAGGTSQFTMSGESTITSATPNGTYDTTGKGSSWHLDEWARCLYQKGVPVSGGDNQTAAVYTIDVYNAQQNDDHTALMMSTARVGGGKYFAATNEGALTNALKQIFAEIQSVNSTFASASLPVNATNRSQNENQVFIGMFRPDGSMKPRWFGNLKRYQLVFDSDGVTVTLGDKNGAVAINNQTGFVGDCAASFWTTDSPLDPANLLLGYYWANVPVSPDPASKCSGLDPSKVYSDSPDGPTVEKGAIAEVIRKGNNPPTTDDIPTWISNRTLYTTADALTTSLTALSGAAALDATQRSWANGTDTQNEDNDISTIETRASLHGDVVHSRPLPVTYGEGDGVIYYGSNDGMFRAIDAESGNELWALMPFEFAQASFVDRLRNNEPIIKYPGTDMTITPTPIAKTYAWDGSIGFAQNLDNTKVWIYPTMRRGGQMVYALNVTDKTTPTIMWKHGCYSGTCTSDFTNIGQTWSAPVIIPVAGYATEKVAVFGGGYDACEDEDSASPACGSPKGANIYVVDAASGSLLKTFDTTRSVVAEVSVVDMDGDGNADYGYAGDTGGDLYRIDMVARSVSGSVVTYTALAPAAWTIRKIAAASGGRKFLFQPALLPLSRDGRVYVAIGSGDREHPLSSNYPYNSVTNRLYVYLDDLTVSSGTVDLNSLDNKTTDLGCSSTSILPTSASVGWFMDLNQYGQGEQTVTSALILAGQVVFSTNRPIPPAAGSCSNVLGEARGYWVNLFNASGTIGVTGTCGGNRSDTFVGGGLPPSPVVGTVLINGKPVTVVIGAANPDGGTSTPISPGKVTPVVTSVRSRVYYKIKGID